MAKTKPLYEFPPNVPVVLIDAYIRLGRSGRKLAKELCVNDFYISQMLIGIEPTNPEIRVKLLLPRKVRKPQKPIPGWQTTTEYKTVKKQIALMAKATRIEIGLQK